MKKLFPIMICIGLLAVVLFTWSQPAIAASNFQATLVPTPTPGADGRILYVVQDGDTIWSITAKFFGTDYAKYLEILELNGLSEGDTIYVGQVLLLGIASPTEATAAPGETAPPGGEPPVLPSAPTQTQILDSSTICVLLFADINGDAVRQETETGIGNGEVSVTERLGTYSDKQTTKAGDPDEPDPLLNAHVCFENIPPGSYNITMAIPEGFNPTTALNVAIELVPGDTSYLNFGAQLSSQAQAQQSGEEDSGRSPLLGIIGITILLAGIGLGVYSVYIGRQG